MIRLLARLRTVVALGLLVVACGPGSATPATIGPPATAGPTQTAAPATAAPPGTGAVPSSPSTSTLLPAATLSAEGGDPVVGQLGSFTWGDGGSDSPWLPGAPIAVGAGEPLAVIFADGAAAGTWRAVRAPADAGTGAGAVSAGEGSGPIGFAITAPGRWTVAVTVAIVGGGTATWYWLVEVT